MKNKRKNAGWTSAGCTQIWDYISHSTPGVRRQACKEVFSYWTSTYVFQNQVRKLFSYVTQSVRLSSLCGFGWFTFDHKPINIYKINSWNRQELRSEIGYHKLYKVFFCFLSLEDHLMKSQKILLLRWVSLAVFYFSPSVAFLLIHTSKK